MQDSGEGTPLLRRSRREAAPEDKDTSFFPLSQNNTSNFSDDTTNKQDRRGFIARAQSWFHPFLHRGSFSIVPTLEDDTHYEDTHNDEPWNCSFGTHETDGIWMNHSDRAGTLMAVIVWVLMGYSGVTIALLAQNQHLPTLVACLYCTLVALALSSHAKTTFTDPGTVPSSAVPIRTQGVKFHAFCSQCQSYKPARTHHCRVCNRCICGMDHHCPWMNNCIGAGNLKHFILFLVYTWTGCAWALLLFAVNYFFCTHERCEFTGTEIVLVRVMTWICVATLLFTSSMLMNVVFAILTGASTIDRLKMKANNTWNEAAQAEVPLKDVFGIGPLWTWCVPFDPIFDDFDRVMGYSTRQRLLRRGASATGAAEPLGSARPTRRRADDAAWTFASPIEV